MRNLITIIALLFSVSVFSQGVRTLEITQVAQLELANINSETRLMLWDSTNYGAVKYVKIGDLPTSGGASSYFEEYTPDVYLGLRLRPTSASGVRGMFFDNSFNGRVGVQTVNTDAGNGATSGFVASTNADVFTGSIAMQHFGNGYFVDYLRNRGAIFSAESIQYVSYAGHVFRYGASLSTAVPVLTLTDNVLMQVDGNTIDLDSQGGDIILRGLLDLQGPTVISASGAGLSLSDGNIQINSVLQNRSLQIRNTGNFTSSFKPDNLTQNVDAFLPNTSGVLANAITDGTTTINADNDGVIDVSAIIPSNAINQVEITTNEYTLLEADIQNMTPHYISASGDVTITIPTTTFVDVKYLNIIKETAGTVTIIPSSGVNQQQYVFTDADLTQTLYMREPNTWRLSRGGAIVSNYTPPFNSGFILNGTFDNATNTDPDTDWTISGGTANFAGIGNQQSIKLDLTTLTNGVTYDLTFDVLNGTGNFDIRASSDNFLTTQIVATSSNRSPNNYTISFTADANHTQIRFRGNTSSGAFSIDNVSIIAQ